MKKAHHKNRHILIYLLIFSLLAAYPAQAAFDISSNNWYYPVTLNDEAYKNMSYDEIIASCNMPENLLNITSTARLVELVLEHPLLINYIAFFENPDDANSYFLRISNIFRELSSRSDAIDTVLEKFEKISVDYSKLASAYADMQNFATKSDKNECVILPWSESGYKQELFLRRFFESKQTDLGDSQKQLLNSIIEEKNTYLSSFNHTFPQYAHFSDYPVEFSNFQNVNSKAVPYGFVKNESTPTYDFVGQGLQYYSGMYYMFNGLGENCVEYASGYQSQTSINAIDSETDTANPYLSRISSANAKFNCHSYAWISTNISTNKWWVASLDIWPSAKTKITSGQAVFGDIIVIKDSYGYVLHSALVMSGGSSANSIMVKSKLHWAGVYSGSLYWTMQTYNGTVYEIYRT